MASRPTSSGEKGVAGESRRLVADLSPDEYEDLVDLVKGECALSARGDISSLTNRDFCLVDLAFLMPRSMFVAKPVNRV